MPSEMCGSYGTVSKQAEALRKTARCTFVDGSRPHCTACFSRKTVRLSHDLHRDIWFRRHTVAHGPTDDPARRSHFTISGRSSLRIFRRDRYAGPIFVPPRTTAAKPRDDGSIFVAVGTSQRGFDRLLRWLDDLRQQGAVQIPIAAQRGHAHHIPQNYPKRSIFT